MSLRRIDKVIEVPTDQDWAEDFRFWKGAARTRPMLIASASASLRRQVTMGNAPAPVELTTANGMLTLQDNVVGPRIAAGQLAGIGVGTYDFALRAVDLNGGSHQLRGVVDLVGPV